MDNYKLFAGDRLIEISVRTFLLCIYCLSEFIPPFQRVLQEEELWLYKYPTSPSYIPMPMLWLLALCIPIGVVILNYFIYKERDDLTEALWCFTLLIVLTGAITNTTKIMVGRPRPDFIERCFPDGRYRPHTACTGNYYVVLDGRKSFPSGHSSVAFSSFGFLSLYLAGKFKLYTHGGKRSALRLVCVLAPLFFATGVAISRTCDYHHHWQDVLAGSLLGFFITTTCYFHYYPPLNNDRCSMPLKMIEDASENLSRIKDI